MPNDIPEKQNRPEFIDRICASSRAYGIVKTVSAWQTSLVASAAIAGPIAAFAFPDARHWAGAYAVVILILDLVLLEPAVKRYQELGAKIQEVFDTELFGLPWNKHRCHAKPDLELVRSLADAFKTKEKTDRLIDWYPTVVKGLPLEYGRLICQRANMVWDASLRRYYSAFFLGSIVVMFVCSFLVALYLNWDFSHIVMSLIVPILPATLKLFREYRKHLDSATISDRTKTMLESTWIRAIEESVPIDELRDESRRLQDELYDRRKSSPTVPQWIYKRRLFEFEKNMRFASNQMVEDAKKKLGLP